VPQVSRWCYRADTYQLIRAGLAGGKGVPESVAGHPCVFATFTAPSFGPVHARIISPDGQVQRCRPRRKHAICPHGRSLSCPHRHRQADACLGQPLCPDCYDSLGLRQGEALGLRWQHVDLDAATLTVRWQLQRLAWRHGCSDPHACGKSRHRPSCPPDCTGHARSCPQRTGGGLRLTELKSDKSIRTIALSPQLVADLRAHRAAQLEERVIAGPAWQDGDYVWCQPNGRPIGAQADWDEWKALLKAAGIRDARVHDARHTAATLLLAQGVDQRVVMEILGHSQLSMTARYAHVLPEVMTAAADRIGQALWGSPDSPGTDSPGTPIATRRPDNSAKR
jgi:Phage integrase family